MHIMCLVFRLVLLSLIGCIVCMTFISFHTNKFCYLHAIFEVCGSYINSQFAHRVMFLILKQTECENNYYFTNGLFWLKCSCEELIYTQNSDIDFSASIYQTVL